MKIFHLLDHGVPIHTGYSFRTLEILSEQRKRGWLTCQLTGIRQLEAIDCESTVNGFYFYRTEYAPLQSVPLLSFLGMIWAMKREAEKVILAEKPNIIHAHSPSLNALAALWANRRFGLPVVYEVRAFWEDAGVDHGTVKANGMRYKLIRMLETLALKKVNAITTICQGLKNEIVARGVAATKVTVIPNAVNVEKFTFRKPRNIHLCKKYGINEDTVVLGFIGSFYAYEGLDLLLKAMPEIHRKRPKVRLLLVGAEEQESALRLQAECLELGNVVEFVGRVPHDEVTDYYSLIDVLVYPRKSMRLTEIVTPLKPLEALAMGKLMVLSDVGGHKEVAGNQFAKCSFEAGNVAALSTKIIERIDSLHHSGNDINSGREYVESERSWCAVVSRYESVYRLLNKFSE